MTYDQWNRLCTGNAFVKHSSIIDECHSLYPTMILGAPSYVTVSKVIFNEPATIVLWSDGSKTVVKVTNNERYDPEKGLAMAIAKKALGINYKKTFKNIGGKI